MILTIVMRDLLFNDEDWIKTYDFAYVMQQDFGQLVLKLLVYKWLHKVYMLLETILFQSVSVPVMK